ncbi:MAG: integrase core domain-containing protein [Armatimonadota bacterium]
MVGPGWGKGECVNRELFADLQEARVVIEAWREEYNTDRPNSSPRDLTPAEFAEHRRQGKMEAARCGLGRATPSLRPHSAIQALTLSPQLVRKAGGGHFQNVQSGKPKATSQTRKREIGNCRVPGSAHPELWRELRPDANPALTSVWHTDQPVVRLTTRPPRRRRAGPGGRRTRRSRSRSDAPPPPLWPRWRS